MSPAVPYARTKPIAPEPTWFTGLSLRAGLLAQDRSPGVPPSHRFDPAVASLAREPVRSFTAARPRRNLTAFPRQRLLVGGLRSHLKVGRHDNGRGSHC